MRRDGAYLVGQDMPRIDRFHYLGLIIHDDSEIQKDVVYGM